MTPFKNVLLIVNPNAGGGKGLRWAPILESALRDKNTQVQTVLSDCLDITSEAVRNCRCDLILVAGGDGTLNIVINSLHQLNRDIPVSLIPIGTGNVFAENMKIPSHPLKALNLLMSGKIVRLDLGQTDGRVFHSVMGIGFDAYVAEKVELSHKRLLGKLAYLTYALRHSMQYKHSYMQVTAELKDGEKVSWQGEAWIIVVNNMPIYVGGLKITPDAVPNDGLLNLCLLPARTRLDYFYFATLGLLRLHLSHPDIIYCPIKWAKIVSEPPVPTQLDGEVFNLTPVSIRVLPMAVSMLLPEPKRRENVKR